jgi:ATP-dependent helicase/nuclease subunit A
MTTMGERRGASKPGDIMILVRRRNAFFDEIIRALKREGVPVAGADRLKLMEHIAVKDLVAAGHAALAAAGRFYARLPAEVAAVRFTTTTICCVLRRGESLYVDRANARICSCEAERSRCGGAYRAMGRRAARTLRAVSVLCTQILSAERGRHAMLARLGAGSRRRHGRIPAPRAAMGARGALPRLSAFLHSDAGRRSVEVKRDMEAAGDAVRVMTVHAAKGLEAKIVFLPDTCAAPASAVTRRSCIELDSRRRTKRAPVWSSAQGV